MPELGYALTAHLCHIAFSGRLSRLFRAVVENGPSTEFGPASMLTSLRHGLDATLERLPTQLAYVRDLVLLGRAMSLLEDFMPIAMPKPKAYHGADESEIEPPEYAVVAGFGHDVPALVRAILPTPTNALPRGIVEPEEVWCLLYRGPLEQPHIARIDRRAGRDLYRMGRPWWTTGRVPSGLVLLRSEQVEDVLTRLTH
jgi:hypothetical protein